MAKEDKKLSDFQLFSLWCAILLLSINSFPYLSNTCRHIWVLLREKQARIQLLIMSSIYHYLWELKLNHILQNNSGSNAKWRAGSLQTASTVVSMLFTAPVCTVYINRHWGCSAISMPQIVGECLVTSLKNISFYLSLSWCNFFLK